MLEQSALKHMVRSGSKIVDLNIQVMMYHVMQQHKTIWETPDGNYRMIASKRGFELLDSQGNWLLDGSLFAETRDVRLWTKSSEYRKKVFVERETDTVSVRYELKSKNAKKIEQLQKEIEQKKEELRLLQAEA